MDLFAQSDSVVNSLSIQPRHVSFVATRLFSLASPLLNDFGRVVTFEKTDEPVTIVDFKKMVTPGVFGSASGRVECRICTLVLDGGLPRYSCEVYGECSGACSWFVAGRYATM